MRMQHVIHTAVQENNFEARLYVGSILFRSTLCSTKPTMLDMGATTLKH